MSETTFVFTGDSFITRNLPKNGYAGLEAVKNIINRHDVRFNNLEITIHENEGYPAAQSGGTWAMTSSEVLRDLASFGFNVFNTANNHSLDYSHGGLLATIENLKKQSLPYCGTGGNLKEASAPAYIETKNSKVAVIGVSASSRSFEWAGNVSAETQGRPGLNPLRFATTYTVERALFDTLKKISEATNMNARQFNSIKNGYAPPIADGKLYFGGLIFEVGEKNETRTTPLERDMKRITASIEDAKSKADYVVVSIHAHEELNGKTEIPAEFLKTFSRTCIDSGADIIAGHGPHELRGIEIYNGKPIFYSIGNFIFQTETVEVQPADAYESLPPGIDIVSKLMNHRSKNGTVGYAVQPNIWRSALFGVTAEDGVIRQIQIYPITLHMDATVTDKGWPELMDGGDAAELLEYLAGLSKPFGTNLVVKHNIGIIDLEEY